jgi:hypothetical protein
LSGQPPSNTILNPGATGAGAIPVRGTNPFLTASARDSIIAYLNNTALFGPGSGTAWGAGAPLPVFLSKIWTDLLPSNAAETTTETYRALVSLEGDFMLGDHDLYWSASLSHAATEGVTRTWDVWTNRFNNAANAVSDGAGGAICAINADASAANDDPACAPLNPFGVGNVSAAARGYLSVRTGEEYLNTQDNLLLTIGRARASSVSLTNTGPRRRRSRHRPPIRLASSAPACPRPQPGATITRTNSRRSCSSRSSAVTSSCRSPNWWSFRAPIASSTIRSQERKTSGASGCAGRFSMA